MLKDAIEFKLAECLAQAEKAPNDSLTPRENSVIFAKKENPERQTRSLDVKAVGQPDTGTISAPSISQACNTSSDKNVLKGSGMPSSPSFIQLNKATLYILKDDPELYAFMFEIATLIRHSDEGVNLRNERVGEAFLKGWKQFGMTRKHYRVLQQRAITNGMMKFRRASKGCYASFLTSEFLIQGPSLGRENGHQKGHQNEEVKPRKPKSKGSSPHKKGPSKGPRKGHHEGHPLYKDPIRIEGVEREGALAPLSFGSFVQLSQDEFNVLKNTHGEQRVLDTIDAVNDYCLASKPAGYANYAAAIRNFIRRNSLPQGHSQEKGKDSAENIRLAKCWEEATLVQDGCGMAAKPDCVLFFKPRNAVEIPYNITTEEFKAKCKPYLSLLTQRKKQLRINNL